VDAIAPDLSLLVLTAASIGFIHTLLGPDHYLPFVALAKARRWSASRTAGITLACGIGHVLSSIVIGAIGIAAGSAVDRLVHIESWRGDIAAWLLFGFGLAYLAWGTKRALRGETHSHVHVHADGTRHRHVHDHRLAPHVHPHLREGSSEPQSVAPEFRPVSAPTAGAPLRAAVAVRSPAATAMITPWALFIIFVFGPCEPLIPVLMYPAAGADWMGVALVCAAFGFATLATMLGVVMLLRRGLDALGSRFDGMERWSHALAGATLSACAAAIVFLGL